jgi:hypothetical protein
MEAPKDGQKPEPAREAMPEPKPEPVKADAPQETDGADRRSSRSRGGRNNNSGGNDSRHNDRGGNRVVGLGDHTPSFIELSFADRPKD